jgi:hypothetical protein
MASGAFKLQLRLIERALEPGWNARERLKDGSPGSWRACGDSISAAMAAFEKSASAGCFAERQWWTAWRASGTSRQFLQLIMAVMEAAATVGRWLPRLALPAGHADMPAAAAQRDDMARALSTTFKTVVALVALFKPAGGCPWLDLGKWLLKQGGLVLMLSAAWAIQMSLMGDVSEQRGLTEQQVLLHGCALCPIGLASRGHTLEAASMAPILRHPS